MFDLVTYALQSQRLSKLVSIGLLTHALNLFQQNIHVHAIKCHQVVSVCIEKLSDRISLDQEQAILLESDKYTVVMQQISRVLIYLFDYYRNDKDVTRKRLLLKNLSLFCDVFKYLYSAARAQQNNLTSQLPGIFYELYDAFIAKSVVCDFMQNFDLNVSLQAVYTYSIEVSL
jgi:hypothetical protein